jgi:hypothetical protein
VGNALCVVHHVHSERCAHIVGGKALPCSCVVLKKKLPQLFDFIWHEIKSKSCGIFFLRRNQLDFILGQHLERQNEQPKADWPQL